MLTNLKRIINGARWCMCAEDGETSHLHCNVCLGSMLGSEWISSVGAPVSDATKFNSSPPLSPCVPRLPRLSLSYRRRPAQAPPVTSAVAIVLHYIDPKP